MIWGKFEHQSVTPIQMLSAEVKMELILMNPLNETMADPMRLVKRLDQRPPLQRIINDAAFIRNWGADSSRISPNFRIHKILLYSERSFSPFRHADMI